MTSTHDALFDDDQWAVTMFSYTTELVAGRRTPQQILLDAVQAGTARRFELDGFQHFASFPEVTEVEAEAFRSDIDRHDIALTEIGLYDDRFTSNGSISIDQRTAFLTQQIDSAAKLGFPAVKLMFGADLELLDALRPALDRHGISLYQEAQGALRADSPELDRQLEYASRHPGAFGFVFDLSACMYGAPVTYLEELRRAGVPEEAVDLIRDEWAHDRTDRTKVRVLELASGVELDPMGRLRLMMPFGRFGNSRVSEFSDLISIAQIVHLKYWDLEDEGGIVSQPMRELHDELERVGFSGPLTSEWGGHEWLSGPEYDPDKVTQEHHRLHLAAVAP